jgi:putative transposase
MSTARIFSAEYKAKIVIEILRGRNTISEIGARENISPKQLGNWKHEFLDNAYRAFNVTKDEKAAKAAVMAAHNREQELMAKIGELTYECGWLKKNMSDMAASKKRELLDDNEPKLSIRRQCELIGYNRSNYYYVEHPRISSTPGYRELIMQRIDYWNTEQPAWGVKTLVPLLKTEGFKISHELLRQLRSEMGIETIYPKQNTSKSTKNARKMPYLLHELRAKDMIWLPNYVWAIDITYIKMGRSHMYLAAIIDWYSRFIVGWELSDTLKGAPILDSVKLATKKYGIPAILNSDQGSQFTSEDYMLYLLKQKISQSMDGRGRWVDNVVIERWFRSFK